MPRKWTWEKASKDRNGDITAEGLVDEEGNSIIYGGGAEWTGLVVIPNEEHLMTIVAAPNLLDAVRKMFKGSKAERTEAREELERIIERLDNPNVFGIL